MEDFIFPNNKAVNGMTDTAEGTAASKIQPCLISPWKKNEISTVTATHRTMHKKNAFKMSLE